MSINLLAETKNELEMHGKTLNDIRWVGCYDYEIPVEQFISLADNEYDNGYGGQEVAIDLIVVGDDWWLERAEYDGSEWWEYKDFPTRPSEVRTVQTVIGGSWKGFWRTLSNLNEYLEVQP